MADQPTLPPQAAKPAPGAAPSPLAQRVAGELAQKHGPVTTPKLPAPFAAAPPPASGPGSSKGGRRTAKEEAEEFLRKNGLVAVPHTAVPGGPPPPVQPPYVVSPEFVKNCFKTLAEGLADWRIRKATLLSLKISGGDKLLAKEVGEDFAPPEGCVDVMSSALEEICRKYELLNQWSPEVIFCVAGAVWFLKDQSGMKKLEAMHKERLDAEKARTVVKPPPPPAAN